MPELAHQLLVEMKIVHSIQMRAEDFIDPLQVVQIGARKMRAGITAANVVEGADVITIARIAQAYRALAGENPAIACVARGHYAIEHVDAIHYGIDDVVG